MGVNAMAVGLNTTASGIASFAEGVATHAAGSYSHAQGCATVANGFCSQASNLCTIAQNMFQTAIGRYNVASNPAYDTTQNDDAFIIGNGNLLSRSNALKVLFNGDVHSAGSVYTGGADYAEMFEWYDRNPEKEDRRGYFVTVQDGYIRKATDKDQYIVGVVSGKPSMVGDAKGCGWQGMYMRDAWGEIIYEWVAEERETLEFDCEAGKEVIKNSVVQVQRPVLNPAYDVNRTYQPRTQRHEWAAVGLMGKLLVRDDGTCEPNGFCRPNMDGIATASEQGYLVLKRLVGDKVLVLLGPHSSHHLCC